MINTLSKTVPLVALLMAGCGDASSAIEVTVARGNCNQSCPLELMLVAYRMPLPDEPCLIKFRISSIDDGQGTLDDLPLTENESFYLGVLAYCSGNPICPVCWDSKQVKAVKGAEHQLSLKAVGNCIPNDTNLLLVGSSPDMCP